MQSSSVVVGSVPYFSFLCVTRLSMVRRLLVPAFGPCLSSHRHLCPPQYLPHCRRRACRLCTWSSEQVSWRSLVLRSWPLFHQRQQSPQGNTASKVSQVSDVDPAFLFWYLWFRSRWSRKTTVSCSKLHHESLTNLRIAQLWRWER
jgi:hypothetical protein